MPIRPYLAGQQFDGETVRIMGVAFEMARAALERDGEIVLAPEVVAAKIIELAKSGELNSDRLCDRTLKYFRSVSRPPG